MNQYQVQDAWKKHGASRLADAQRAASERLRQAEVWVLHTFPSACEDDYPDPFLLLSTLHLKASASGPVTKTDVLEYARAYHAGRHERGWISDADLAEELTRLEAV